MSTLKAVRHVLRVRTNVVLIVASSIGYFFFAGMQTFAVVFARDQYGLSQVSATVLLALTGGGALLGVLLAGRLADRLLAGGHSTPASWSARSPTSRPRSSSSRRCC